MLHQLDLMPQVQMVCRLIQQDDARFLRQRPRQEDALQLAAGKAVDGLSRQVCHFDGLQAFHDLVAVRLARRVEQSLLHAGIPAEHDGFVYAVGKMDGGKLAEHGYLPRDVAPFQPRDVLSVKPDDTAGKRQQAAGRTQQGCLAASVGPEQTCI